MLFLFNGNFLYLLLIARLLLPITRIEVTVNSFVPVQRQRSDQKGYRTKTQGRDMRPLMLDYAVKH